MSCVFVVRRVCGSCTWVGGCLVYWAWSPPPAPPHARARAPHTTSVERNLHPPYPHHNALIPRHPYAPPCPPSQEAEDDAKFIPLSEVNPYSVRGREPTVRGDHYRRLFRVFNSSLSEAAVLGFEYGACTVWGCA